MRLLLLLILLNTASFGQTTALIVDTFDSKITWTGTKVIGFHQGTIKILNGTVTMTNGKLSGGEFIIDMNSIACTDIPDAEPIPKKKLENHLKSADFFNVAQYPKARFIIHEVRPDPTQPKWLVARGELTIKGETRELKIQIEPITQNTNLLLAQADVRFNRQWWGVAYTGIKDELVHDEIKLNIILRAK